MKDRTRGAAALEPAFDENNIPVIVAASNQYAPYAGVFIQSLINHASREKNYDIIDLFKFIASIFILSMHANVFESVNCNLQFYLVQLLSRWGVEKR